MGAHAVSAGLIALAIIDVIAVRLRISYVHTPQLPILPIASTEQ